PHPAASAATLPARRGGTHCLPRAAGGNSLSSPRGGEETHWLPRAAGGDLLQGSLDQGDVHPAVELVRGVFYRADRFEAQLRVELQAGPVVGGDGGHDGEVAEVSRFPDQLGEQRLADAAALVDGVDVNEVLHHVETALLPRKEARPADDPGLICRHEKYRALAMRLPPMRRLLGVQRFRVDGGEGLVDGPVVDADDGAKVVVGGGPDADRPGSSRTHPEIIA